MTANLGDVFADTSYWLALVVRQDAHHDHAYHWTQRLTGRIVTSELILVETASALSRQAWRPHAIRLIEHLRTRKDVEILPAENALLKSGWTLFCQRKDKEWSWVDCVSFVAMQQHQIEVALTSDHHFEQAGFRAVLLETPR